jgi:hypothetical protein
VIARHIVGPCPQTYATGGALLLDPSGGPHWKLVSTQCGLYVRL